MKPILHTLHGGSGTGMSYYRGLVTCPRRRWLDDQAAAQGLRTSSDGDDTEIGTIYHALQELAEVHGQGLDTSVVEYVQAGGDPWAPNELSRQVADNLFRAYRVRFPAGHLGKLVAAEDDGAFLSFEADEEYDWKPAGIPLTMRLDWVRRIGIKNTMTLRTLRGVNVQPGLYGGDYKTAGGYASGSRLEAYRQDLQFMAYQFGWNTRNPKRPLSGFLVDIAWKPAKATGRPEFTLLWIPPVGPKEAKIVRSFLELARTWQAIDPPPANPGACFSWNRLCKWMIEEQCRRY